MSESLKWKLIKNAGWLFGAKIIANLLSYGIIVFLSRTLGPAGLGQYSFIFYYIGLLGIFSDFGIGAYFTREVAREKSRLKELLPDVLGFKVVLAVFNFLAIVIVTFFLPKPSWLKLLVILAGAEAMLTWVSYLFVNIMYAHEVTKYEAIAQMTERFWAFFVGSAALWEFRELSPFIIALLTGYVIRDLLRIKFGLRFVGELRIRFRPEKWVSLLKKSYPFWFIGLFTMIYYRTDTVMLSIMGGDYKTGIYRAAFTLIEVSLFIPNIILATTMPSMARLWKEDRKMLGVLFRKSFHMLLVLGIVGTLGYYIFARFGILLVFGDNFLPSVPILRVLAISVPFMFMNSLMGSYMNATGRELTFTKITGFTALLNIVLNYVLIPHYGATGAAVATVVSQGTASVLSYLFVQR